MWYISDECKTKTQSLQDNVSLVILSQNDGEITEIAL